MADNEQVDDTEGGVKQVIQPQKIYIKDLSFETPNSPQIFTAEWRTKTDVDVQSTTQTIGEDVYEIVMNVTVTVKLEDKTAFLVEVQQAGIFYISGFDDERLDRLQRVYCLKTLYPFACATVSELVTRGGFPQLLLEPINFDVLYEHHKNKFKTPGENTGPEEE